MPASTACNSLGLFSKTDVSSLVQEVHSMYKLSHTNVMSLTGVCVDASGGPAIVMPYMANGSVLHYLKREREKLVVPEDADPGVVSLVFHQCTNALAGVFLLPQSPYCHGQSYYFHMWEINA